jgi:MFS transporter, ACS family, glucarate transporter
MVSDLRAGASDETGIRNRGILSLLWAFAFLSYLLRINITVAQQLMARELSLSDIQVGYVFTAFLIGYTLFQVPAGVLGDRFGPRVVLTVSGLCWGATTLLTGLTPGLLVRGAAMALLALLVLRFLHGAFEAATYPVAMSAVSDWFPPRQHAFVNSVIFTGSTLGSAFAPPLVANIMNAVGWRPTFYLAAILPVAVAGLWWRSSRGERPDRKTVAIERPQTSVTWWRLLTQRNVFFLCLSYLLYCYAISIFVYWLYKYLVDVRHLSIVNGGWGTSLPWIAASVAVPVFGYLSTKLSRTMSVLPARRLVATACLCVSAVLMWAGASAQHIVPAISAIAASVALLFSTESSYWSTAIDVAREDAGAASGLMNLAGNLGGVLSTSLVPVLVTRLGWFDALLSGSVFALLAAASWFPIRKGGSTEPGVLPIPVERLGA